MGGGVESRVFARTYDYIDSLAEPARTVLYEVVTSDQFYKAAEWYNPFSPIHELHASSLKGYIFAWTAFHFMRKIHKEKDEVLLTPDQTFDVYQLLFPDRKVIDRRDQLQRGLRGITVPSGVFVRRIDDSTGILGAYRYISNIHSLYMDLRRRLQRCIIWDNIWLRFNFKPLTDPENTQALQVGSYLHNQYDQLPNRLLVNTDGLRMKYVLPEGIPDIPNVGMEDQSRLPYHTLDFYRLIHTVFADIRSDPAKDTPSLPSFT